MKHYLLFIANYSLFIILLSGCTKEQRPEGLPKLFPCSLIITQEGMPLADTAVQLIPKQENVFPSTGTTNSGGRAIIVTYGKFTGVPEGSYTAVFAKNEVVQKTKGDDYNAGISEIYSLINVNYMKAETSPCSIEVKKGRNEFKFDLGKKVRVLVDKITPGT